MIDNWPAISAWLDTLPPARRTKVNRPDVVVRGWRRAQKVVTGPAAVKRREDETFRLILGTLEASAGKPIKEQAQRIWVAFKVRRPPVLPTKARGGIGSVVITKPVPPEMMRAG